MKIGIDLTWFSGRPTGVDNYTFNLIKYLLNYDQNNQYSLFLLRRPLGFERFEDNKFYKMVKAILAGNEKYLIEPVYILGRIFHTIKRRKIPFLKLAVPKADVILFPNFEIWPFAEGKKVEIIYDLGYELFPEYCEDKVVKTYTKWVPKFAKMADLIIAISEFTKQEITKIYKIPPKKIKVVYPAIDEVFFTKASKDKIADVLDKYHLENDYMLFVGTIEPRKNVIGLVKAYEEYCAMKGSKKVDLVLAGKIGWKSDGVIEYIKKSKYVDRIKLLQYVPYSPALYKDFCYLTLFL